MLHGWGIVCGLEIQWKPGRSCFVVKPGMALDCYGNEIVVCNDTTVDLGGSKCSSIGKKEVPLTPEECEKIAKGKKIDIERWIGIRYNETGTAPVPVYTPGDECGKQDCANSRTKEGYCVDILSNCPGQNNAGYGFLAKLFACIEEERLSGQKSPPRDHSEVFCACFEKSLHKFCQAPIPCPDGCHDSPYVGLGQIILTRDNCIKNVHHELCRRYVIGSYLTNFSLYELCCTLGMLLGKCAHMKEMEKKIEDLYEKIGEIEKYYRKPITKKSPAQKK
jgi:hypothetical protein